MRGRFKVDRSFPDSFHVSGLLIGRINVVVGEAI
jgi:hypothetical protein